MKTTLRLLAAVKPGRYLEAGTPTGLTGLLTHQSPRPQLLLLYGATLDALKAFPEISVYRQSTEALTKHRMKIVEQIKPAGYEEWERRARETIEKNPEIISQGNSSRISSHQAGDYLYVGLQNEPDADAEWDGEVEIRSQEGTTQQRRDDEEFYREEDEGITGEEEVELDTKPSQSQDPSPGSPVKWEPEPALEATQISEMEAQIGAGLIEEVIDVAEGELQLVETMKEHKVWEELEERPPTGQWSYFARDTSTPGTQAPNK